MSISFATNDVKFVYDGWNLIAILNSSFTLQTSFVWGSDLSGSIQGTGGVGGLLFICDLPSAIGYSAPAFDGNGNVMALVSMSGGTNCAAYEYGPFGEVIRATGPMAKANPFRWSTKYQDDESDIVMYPHRPYSASQGRFLTRDPADELGFNLTSEDEADGGPDSDLQNSGNLFRFVNNNPITETDGLGLWPSSHNPLGVIIGIHSPLVHQASIKRAIPGLDARDYAISNAATVEVDEGQGTAESYQHAMRDGLANQSVSAAKDKANDFVRLHLSKAEILLCSCNLDRDQALHEFGLALHTIQDSTSPAHHGFQPWNGEKGHLMEAIAHVRKEDYDPGAGSQLDQATSWFWSFFTCTTAQAQPLPTDFFSSLGADPPKK
jgi:RHS repeat-associated protein